MTDQYQALDAELIHDLHEWSEDRGQSLVTTIRAHIEDVLGSGTAELTDSIY